MQAPHSSEAPGEPGSGTAQRAQAGELGGSSATQASQRASESRRAAPQAMHREADIEDMIARQRRPNHS